MPDTLIQKLNSQIIDTALLNAASIDDIDVRKHSFVSNIVLQVLKSYLKLKGVDIEENNNLQSCYYAVCNFDIADIRTKNNVIIDARVVVGSKASQVCIPRKHFTNGCEADVYIGIRLDQELNHLEILGCIKTEDLIKTKGNNEYYFVSPEDLYPVEEIEGIVNSIKKRPKQYISVDHEKAEKQFIGFIDGTINEENKNYLINHLYNCSLCRSEFIKFCKLDSSIKELNEKLLLGEDYTLRLFSDDSELKKEEAEIEIPFTEQEVFEDLSPEEVFEEEQYEELELSNKEETDNIIDFAEKGIEEEPKLEEYDELDIVEQTAEQPEEPDDIQENNQLQQAQSIKAEENESKKHGLDWADELLQKSGKGAPPPDKDFINEDTLGSITLEEETIDLDEADIEIFDLDHEELMAGNVINSQPAQEKPVSVNSNIEEQPPEESQNNTLSLKEEEAAKQNNPQDKDMEDLLDMFEDVEEYNTEEDIDGLLSIIDNDDSEEQQKEALSSDNVFIAPEEEEIKPDVNIDDNYDFASQSIPFDSRTIEQTGDYSVVLGSDENENTAEGFDENLDILMYDQKKSPNQEIINQEDFFNLFNTNIEPEEQKEEPKDLKTKIKSLCKDKNMVAFTVAVTLSSTVLFTYLGQINQQVQNANIALNTENLTNGIKKEKADNNFDNPVIKVEALNKNRTPIISYTREIVKSVSQPKPLESPKEEQVNNITPQEEEKNTTTKQTEQKVEKKFIAIKNISWELSESTAKEPLIKKYFLDIGYILKSYLSKNLYTPDISVENAQINIYAELNSKGALLDSIVFEGSGFEEIDKKCLTAFKKMLKDNKFPNSYSGNNKVKLKLLIKI